MAAYEVRHRGNRIRLARQPMEPLLLLLERRQELVSREDMAKRLWGPDVFTDLDAGIHTAVLKIRQVLGDSRESPRFVETVPGKGYRFVAPVEVVEKSPRRHNLPTELTSFVGREQELLELPGALASSRLLSMTGAGGAGKTRLAVRLASQVVNDFPDGVWLVDLAPLTVPDPSPRRSQPHSVSGKVSDRSATPCSTRCGIVICCWSWTTASISSHAAPSSSKPCSARRPRCGFSRRAAKHWACPARPSGASPRYHSRKPWHRSPLLRCATSSPRSSSSIERVPWIPPSNPLRRTRTPSSASAGALMGFPSLSSWPPPVSSSCRRRRSRRGCSTDSGC